MTAQQRSSWRTLTTHPTVLAGSIPLHRGANMADPPALAALCCRAIGDLGQVGLLLTPSAAVLVVLGLSLRTLLTRRATRKHLTSTL